jgi:DNA-binding transcriptional ArsR family regulator
MLDSTYGALAHPVRRAILQRLGPGPLRVTDVAGSFDVSLAAVSKHVMVLERAGLVRRQRLGREHWLTFEADRLSEAEAWIETCRGFWNRSLDALDRLLREELDQEPPLP